MVVNKKIHILARFSSNFGIMKRILLSIIILISVVFTAKADHYAGAELTYRCLGPNGANFDYEITMVVYRDCSGEILDEFYDVIYNSTCLDDTVTLQATGDAVEISPEKECSNAPTLCESPTSLILGREKRTYTGTISIPICAGDYTFSFRRNFRNTEALSNVDNAEQPFYVEMNFNNSIENCNGSYAFSDNIMSKKICTGEYFRFDFKNEIVNNGADSLFFELSSPLVDGVSGVTYNAGFGFSNPIATQGPFNFDGNTGVLEFTSVNIPQSSILTVKIYEYDANGNLLGTSLRDMQLIIEVCNNNAPEILGINGTQEDTIYLCGGRMTCFDIPVTDIDQDNIFLNPVINPGIAGLTISRVSNLTTNSKYRFCFNPDTTGTYTFDLRVDDRHCPDTLEDVRTITIIVPNDTVFQCECANVSFNYDNICLGSNTQFNGVPVFSLGTSVTNWSWDFGDGNGSNQASPSHQYAGPGEYDVTVEFTDDAGCVKSSTSTLRICDRPDVGFTRLDSCQTSAETPTFVRFQDTTSSECSIMSRLWDYGDGTSDMAGSHSYLDSGWYNVQLILGYGDPNAPTVCYDTTDKDMYVYPRPEFTIHPDDFLQSCYPTYDTLFSISLLDTSNELQWYYRTSTTPWITFTEAQGGNNDSILVPTEGLTINVDNGRNIDIRIEIEDSLGCVNDSIRTIYDPIKPRMLNTPYCEPGDTITFWDITDTTDNISLLEYGFLNREWDFNDPNDPFATSSLQTAQHYYDTEGVYTADLYVVDNDSCFDFAQKPTIKVVLPDHTFHVRASLDPTRDNDTICFNTQSVIFEGPNKLDATIDKYVWTFDDAGVDSVILSNNYNGTFSMQKFGNNIGVSTTTQSGDVFTHRYDSLDFGTKFVHLKMIYNTIRNDKGFLVDSLFCVRHYYDTIDIRPPQKLSWLVQKNCWYDTIQLDVNHLIGDTLTSWLVDWGDEDLINDSTYTDNDTAYFDGFAFPDSIYSEYMYTDYDKPDDGYRDIYVTVNDIYGCENRVRVEQNYRIHKIDTQLILPFNFCDNQRMFFPPDYLDPNGRRTWNDRWNNIKYIHWDFGTGNPADTNLLNLDFQSEDTVRFDFPSDTIYEITVTAIGNPDRVPPINCRTQITKQLAVQPAPNAELDIPGISCVGSPIVFVDKSTTREKWALDENDMFVRVPDTLTQWVLYIDGDTINMSDEVTTINGDTVDLENFSSGGFPYTYSSSYYDTVILVAITDTGCVDSDTIFPVYTAPYPIANFTYETSLPGPRSEIIFTDSTDWIEDNIQHPDSAYQWTLTDDEGNLQLYEFGWDLEEIIYQIEKEDIFNMELIVMNEFRCTDTISKEVDSYAYLDFPTAFSPTEDGDARNNVFRLHHKGFEELLEYRIFNRYGEVVFQGQDLDDTWDGRYKGRMQETGMYVVVVRAVDVLGRENKVQKKNVLLVR